jgi:hypothetical protein
MLYNILLLHVLPGGWAILYDVYSVYTYPSIYELPKNEILLQRTMYIYTIFQFTNIIFITMKNQPSSESRVPASLSNERGGTQQILVFIL